MTVTKEEILQEIDSEMKTLNDESADLVLQISNLRVRLRKMNLEYRKLAKQRKAVEKNISI